MDITIKDFLEISFFNNTMQRYLIAIAITLAIYLLFDIVITFIIRKLAKIAEKTTNDLDDVAITTLRKIKWPTFLIILLLTLPALLTTPTIVNSCAKYAIIIILTYEIIKVATTFVDYGAEKAIKKQGQKGFIKPFSTIIKTTLWILGGVLVLANLGYNVSSLIAGLGIGGIAIALALQNILGDIFSSLSIYFDKTFKPGDYIVIGTNEGTVKSVGIKTTRLTSVQGEELVIPNATLVNSNIQNFGKLKSRRNQFKVGISYKTPGTKIEKAKKIIQKTIESTENAVFDRAFLKTLGDYSLIFDVVYFAETGDFKEFLEINEKINLGILSEFEKAKIEIAYPTQMVHVKKT